MDGCAVCDGNPLASGKSWKTNARFRGSGAEVSRHDGLATRQTAWAKEPQEGDPESKIRQATACGIWRMEEAALGYHRRSMLDALSARRHRPARPVRWLAIAALGLAAPSGGCNRPQAPSVTPQVVRVAGVGAGGLDLDVQLQVHNPNSFPLSAEAVEGTLYDARDRKLGVGRSTPGDSIPAGGSSIVASKVHIDWQDLTALAPLLVSEHIPYEFRGDVTLGGESIHVTLPFTLTGELTRTQLLQAGLRGL
jgi:LEA14-like dessication related protein